MIPATAHFVWFGPSFPWMHVPAMRSAAVHGGFERVVLHHADDLTGSPFWSELSAIPGFEARSLDPAALFGQIPRLGPQLTELFSLLTQPAARANMVRAALLFTEGGVYLDTDTITVADLTPLRQSGVFYGVEHVVLPAAVARSLNPLKRLAALGRDGLRDVCRRMPRGWRLFQRIERSYARAANNAVLGAEPGHAFVANMLQRMVDMEPKRRLVRYALGTHLLQDTAAGWAGAGVTRCEPAVFYPLGPEISGHWFRAGTAGHLDELCPPSTKVVHWYASVRTKSVVPTLNPETIRAGVDDVAICALTARYGM